MRECSKVYDYTIVPTDLLKRMKDHIDDEELLKELDELLGDRDG